MAPSTAPAGRSGAPGPNQTRLNQAILSLEQLETRFDEEREANKQKFEILHEKNRLLQSKLDHALSVLPEIEARIKQIEEVAKIEYVEVPEGEEGAEETQAEGEGAEEGGANEEEQQETEREAALQSEVFKVCLVSHVHPSGLFSSSLDVQ